MKKLIYTTLLTILYIPLMAQYQFLGGFNELGVPDYLDERDVVSKQLLDDIDASLPESKPVPLFNPHLISSGYDNDIQLLDSADVWVTFVKEGAGYRNVLGFYSYDLSAPYLSTPSKEDITIIFPNVSGEGSGGGLVAGDKVKIGTFSANTGIGWVLIANGYLDNQVTDGSWVLYSNPNFNPESKKSDRYHNVLLNDPEEDLIILGFEDIRRDYASCDQDFNDAIFYVTANPIEAIARNNIAEIVDSKSVSSGNDGGLESNGDLASAIAQRQLNRVKNNNRNNVRTRQMTMSAHMRSARTNGSHVYLPTTGFTGQEEVRVSSPEDLIGLTNAEEVFATDYYLTEQRVAAALLTKTSSSVYNHSKNVCDRLNGGSIEDLRSVEVKGHQVIFAKINTDSTTSEYASWFSVQNNGESYKLYSLWNIDNYPEGDYLNFQVWGASPAQVFHTLNYILNQLESEKTVQSNEQGTQIPKVLVKRGNYSQGRLTLEITNPQQVKQIEVTGNIRSTENSSYTVYKESIALSGNYTESISIDMGGLFDAGISVQVPNETAFDALYLADGAWGTDYNPLYSSIDEFSVATTENPTWDSSQYILERNIQVSGRSSDVVNIFRNTMAGHGSLEISQFSSLSFDIDSNTPLEVVLIENNLSDWSQRLRTTVASTDGIDQVVLPLDEFTRGEATNTMSIGTIQSVVFSFINTRGEEQSFEFEISNLRFGNEQVVMSIGTESHSKEFMMYPNPTNGQVNLEFSEQTSGQVSVFDMSGRLMQHQHMSLTSKSSLDLTLQTGLYWIVVDGSMGRQSRMLKIY
ncbi:DUF4114 domain-containing protein [Reichenbachiella agarivorans]|uniref:DUF4114 domain-containing protein n=1 Tax=Reichenbachiella agarivorans TaxID=2979464 RepID=A0ABY6CNL1_9BACT|nr:DUF4114 domain-containing protein [Reichenbachiella agarivorans]UXP32107.1 DUF4114 domain-containing protein [Reichenbachiella agarivorans]